MSIFELVYNMLIEVTAVAQVYNVLLIQRVQKGAASLPETEAPDVLSALGLISPRYLIVYCG